MASDITLKIYNKDNKLKLLIQETNSIKVINIYKYYENFEEIHSFSYFKNSNTKYGNRFIKSDKNYAEIDLGFERNLRRKNMTSYYDLIVSFDGVLVEKMWITNLQSEHWKLTGYMEEIKTTEIFESGNYFEQRRKRVGDEIYVSEFKNGIITDFHFTMPENKINEYLDKLHYE